MSSRHALVVGALLATAGVALGAWGAHGLEDRLVALGYEAELPQRLAWFDTGVRYHLYHALALVVIGQIGNARSASVALLIGILLFSGSLYAMTLLPVDWKKLGAVVPLGGLAFMIGWLLVAHAAYRAETA